MSAFQKHNTIQQKAPRCSCRLGFLSRIAIDSLIRNAPGWRLMETQMSKLKSIAAEKHGDDLTVIGRQAGLLSHRAPPMLFILYKKDRGALLMENMGWRRGGRVWSNPDPSSTRYCHTENHKQIKNKFWRHPLALVSVFFGLCIQPLWRCCLCNSHANKAKLKLKWNWLRQTQGVRETEPEQGDEERGMKDGDRRGKSDEAQQRWWTVKTKDKRGDDWKWWDHDVTFVCPNLTRNTTDVKPA